MSCYMYADSANRVKTGVGVAHPRNTATGYVTKQAFVGEAGVRSELSVFPSCEDRAWFMKTQASWPPQRQLSIDERRLG